MVTSSSNGLLKVWYSWLSILVGHASSYSNRKEKWLRELNMLETLPKLGPRYFCCSLCDVNYIKDWTISTNLLAHMNQKEKYSYFYVNIDKYNSLAFWYDNPNIKISNQIWPFFLSYVACANFPFFTYKIL